ncbi:hypothetical protein QT972_09800 [Microcoleus sp. herbarium7]|uniref:hypothetical protein n=1 Tax=Microcoleus sp. herbarium7 TaxID=3055435 RepID=UPI002FD2985A
MHLTVSTANDADPEQFEHYRDCAIDLTLASTDDWNELWSYKVTSDWGDGIEIAKCNGLATKAIAMQSAKAWIDDFLGDRNHHILSNEGALRKDWLKLKLEKRNKN